MVYNSNLLILNQFFIFLNSFTFSFFIFFFLHSPSNVMGIKCNLMVVMKSLSFVLELGLASQVG